MENNIDKYIVDGTEEVTPVIVLTGNLEEFERFCSQTRRNTKTAIAVRQGFQIPFYPDVPIVLFGNYEMNSAYNSPEYKERVTNQKIKEFNLNG